MQSIEERLSRPLSAASNTPSSCIPSHSHGFQEKVPCGATVTHSQRVCVGVSVCIWARTPHGCSSHYLFVAFSGLLTSNDILGWFSHSLTQRSSHTFPGTSNELWRSDVSASVPCSEAWGFKALWTAQPAAAFLCATQCEKHLAALCLHCNLQNRNNTIHFKRAFSAAPGSFEILNQKVVCVCVCIVF